MVATSGFAITPSDSDDLPGATTGGIYVGTSGTMTVSLLHGPVMQFSGAVGYIPVVATKVWSTGTSAGGMTGLKT